MKLVALVWFENQKILFVMGKWDAFMFIHLKCCPANLKLYGLNDFVFSSYSKSTLLKIADPVQDQTQDV